MNYNYKRFLQDKLGIIFIILTIICLISVVYQVYYHPKYFSMSYFIYQFPFHSFLEYYFSADIVLTLTIYCIVNILLIYMIYRSTKMNVFLRCFFLMVYILYCLPIFNTDMLNKF